MKTWQIEIEGNKHIVDVQNSSFLGGGCVMLDGLRTCEWGLSVYGLPAQIKFEIQGKKAEIKRKGFMANTPVLFLEGKEVS
ncbi:MAG: hypothetical protein WCF70_02185 [Dehalococcoidales bacterium]|jgi:hypothetical protein